MVLVGSCRPSKAFQMHNGVWEWINGHLQERPGLVVLTIELEGALAQMPGSLSPSRMWSPYREPLAKFLNKYSAEVGSFFNLASSSFLSALKYNCSSCLV